MTNKILVLNMKMYMDINDVKRYLSVVKSVPDNVILCPESIYIPYFLNKYKNIAIQSISKEDSGAYTGSISARQVKMLGVNYAVIGHSECRKYFNVTDDIVNSKIKSALANKLRVILCIGESKEENELLKTKEVLKRQLDIALDGVVSDNIIIAYEPIFSIGTGIVPTNEYINDTILYIKQIVRSKGMDLKVLYGGSVNSNNIKDLLTIPNVDGFMVGKSSSKEEEVLKMIKQLDF